MLELIEGAPFPVVFVKRGVLEDRFYPLIEVLTKPHEEGNHAVAQDYRRRLVDNP